MTLNELREQYYKGLIEKKLYWQLSRENYLWILPQLQTVIANNPEVDSVILQKDGVIIKKKSGMSFYFDFSQSICRAEADILLEGDPEKEDMEYIDSYISGKADGVVFDIGANAGIFSLEYYRKHNNLDYYLFEPIPNTFELLKKNADLNGVDYSGFHLFNLGMSDKKGSFDFYVPASNEAASLVENTDEFYRKKADENGRYTGDTEIEKVTCKVSRVDDFVRENNVSHIDIMKIDVEGNEKYVLEGARETLLRDRPLVYCELLRKHAARFGYHPNDVISFMKELGFFCYTIVDGKRNEVTEVTEDTRETNFFFEDVK